MDLSVVLIPLIISGQKPWWSVMLWAVEKQSLTIKTTQFWRHWKFYNFNVMKKKIHIQGQVHQSIQILLSCRATVLKEKKRQLQTSVDAAPKVVILLQRINYIKMLLGKRPWIHLRLSWRDIEPIHTIFEKFITKQQFTLPIFKWLSCTKRDKA